MSPRAPPRAPGAQPHAAARAPSLRAEGAAQGPAKSFVSVGKGEGAVARRSGLLVCERPAAAPHPAPAPERAPGLRPRAALWQEPQLAGPSRRRGRAAPASTQNSPRSSGARRGVQCPRPAAMCGGGVNPALGRPCPVRWRPRGRPGRARCPWARAPRSPRRAGLSPRPRVGDPGHSRGSSPRFVFTHFSPDSGSCLEPKSTTLSGGSLGSRVDEERS